MPTEQVCTHTNAAVEAFQKCAISRGNLVSVTRQRAKVKTRLSQIGTQRLERERENIVALVNKPSQIYTPMSYTRHNS
jgi:hypothetical protein